MQKLLATFFLIVFSPLFLLLYLLVRVTSKGPFIFKQKRAGKNKKPFYVYKIRTMVANAEAQKLKLKNKNEADGPVFKIHDDPRYTKVGRFLAHTGIDELPQLINIIKGDMVFVGPRPLPVYEAEKVPKKYERRFSVSPGISSLWAAEGAEHSDFNKWMKQDLEYVKNKSFWYDLTITKKTIGLIIKMLISNIKS